MRRFERFQEATTRLESELDIINIIQVHRLAKFMAKLSMSSKQRQLVQNFREYLLSDLGESKKEANALFRPAEEDDEAIKPPSTCIQMEEIFIDKVNADSLLSHIKLEALGKDQRQEIVNLAAYLESNQMNNIDRRILYEVTGY